MCLSAGLGRESVRISIPLIERPFGRIAGGLSLSFVRAIVLP